jgi:hypothetical protein
MANTRPIQFLHYTCGHSLPVRGNGAALNRACPCCLKNPRRTKPGLGELTLATMLGERPPITYPETLKLRKWCGHSHPSADCDCDMCQSRLP